VIPIRARSKPGVVGEASQRLTGCFATASHRGTVPSHSVNGAQCQSHDPPGLGWRGRSLRPFAQSNACRGSASRGHHGNSRSRTTWATSASIGSSRPRPAAMYQELVNPHGDPTRRVCHSCGMKGPRCPRCRPRDLGQDDGHSVHRLNELRDGRVRDDLQCERLEVAGPGCELRRERKAAEVFERLPTCPLGRLGPSTPVGFDRGGEGDSAEVSDFEEVVGGRLHGFSLPPLSLWPTARRLPPRCRSVSRSRRYGAVAARIVPCRRR
jgi:hypothetical protein